jgi:hypothetical protein
VHDPIRARAWVIDDGNTTMAFAVFDTVGTSNRVLNRIRAGVLANTGIPYENIHLSSTHTHAGPDMQGLWGGCSDNYKNHMETGTIEAITEAWETRRPVRLYASKGNGTQYNGNRRGWGWTNDEITVLDAIDASNGERVGTVLNFAAHPTSTGSGNKEFSGDWCHYTRVYMEAGTGGAPNIFVNGPIGDVSVSGCSGGGFVGAETCGGGVGTLGLQFMAEGRTQVTGPLYSHTEYYNHPVTNIAFVVAYAIGWLDYDVVPINGTGDFSFDTQLSYFRIGNTVEGVAFPGESLTRNAYPVLETMNSPFKLFLGLTGDTLGYMVPSDEWNYLTGYEEKVSIDKFFGDVSRDLAISMIESAHQEIKLQQHIVIDTSK